MKKILLLICMLCTLSVTAQERMVLPNWKFARGYTTVRFTDNTITPNQFIEVINADSPAASYLRIKGDTVMLFRKLLDSAAVWSNKAIRCSYYHTEKEYHPLYKPSKTK